MKTQKSFLYIVFPLFVIWLYMHWPNMFQRFANDWLDQVNAPIGPSRRGRNKLRTYRQFKHSYSVEDD